MTRSIDPLKLWRAKVKQAAPRDLSRHHGWTHVPGFYRGLDPRHGFCRHCQGSDARPT